MRHGVAAVAVVLCMLRSAKASFVYSIQQVGSDVVGTGSGTLDLTDLSYRSNGTVPDFVNPSTGQLYSGTGSFANYQGAISGPSSFGSGGTTDGSTESGDAVGIFGSSPLLIVPNGYGGGALSSTETWSTTTLSSLGLTSGVYSWTWGTGAHADTFTLDVGSPTTMSPEPGTGLLLFCCITGLVLARANKAKSSIRI